MIKFSLRSLLVITELSQAPALSAFRLAERHVRVAANKRYCSASTFELLFGLER